jgi:hypothetical protein
LASTEKRWDINSPVGILDFRLTIVDCAWNKVCA